MKILIFTTQYSNDLKSYMSHQPIHELENAMSEDSDIDCTLIPYNESESIVNIEDWILSKTGHHSNHFEFIFFTLLSSRSNILTIRKLTNIDQIRTKKIVYIIDYWEYDKQYINIDIVAIKPDIIFYAYLDNEGDFSTKSSCWLPLAESSETFKLSYKSKNREFLQFGRKYSRDFEDISNFAKEYKFKMTDLGNLDFFDQVKYWKLRQKASGLSKIISEHHFSLVSYSSLENADKIGNISPITPRYYQIMLSGTIPIGVFPEKESEILFGNNIEYINTNHKLYKDKVFYFLSNNKEYENVVLNNYEHIEKFHTYKNRVNIIKLYLKESKCYYQQ